MKGRAVAYCQMGENCSRAVLRAAADKYHFDISREMTESLGGVSAGFGIGSICSALVAGVMVLGVLFPESEAKQKSLCFFCRVQEKWGCMDCCRLAATRTDCTDLIGEICEILEDVIER